MSVKKHLRPRNADCLFIEADYAQLEIRVLALATNCPQLIKDINDGIDLHRHFAAQIFGKPEAEITDAERKLAKGFSFQLQYGAGAPSIAAFWGVPKKLVQAFITAYYNRYPEIKEWQNRNIESVAEGATYNGEVLDNARSDVVSIKSSVVPSIWPQGFGGFHITEKCYDTRVVFPGTQIKNYPIQGGAADIVMLMLNNLRKEFLVGPAVLGTLGLVGTVHDSFLFETFTPLPQADVLYLGESIRNYLSQVPELLELKHNIVSPIQFPVDVTVGRTWEEQVPLDKFAEL